MPVSTRSMASPTEHATPMDRLSIIARCEMPPFVMVSTLTVEHMHCRLGDDEEIAHHQPERHKDPAVAALGQLLAQIVARRIKPTLTPVRNSARPTKV